MKSVGHSIADGLEANGLAIVLSALGLLVSLPVWGGGGWSRVASYFYPPPVNRLSNDVHSTCSATVLSDAPVNIPSASSTVNDRGNGSSKITALPTELVVNILANLSIQDLLVCKQVCKNWQSLVTTVPALARAAYRSCHPTGYVPRLNDTFKSYHGSLRQWLNSFGEHGREVVTRLDRMLASGEPPHFPEQLFFAIARVLDEAPAFHCRKVHSIKHPHGVGGACLSPDELHLLSYSGYNTVCICRFVRGRWQEADTLRQTGQVIRAYFSPDSKHFVVCLSNRHASIWVLADGQWQQQADWYPVSMRSFPQFNADTTYLVTVSRHNNSGKIHRLIDGQWQPQVTALDHYSVLGASFHPTESNLLATYCHNMITLWRSVDGRWQQDGALQHVDTVSNIRFSPDGNRLMTYYRECPVSSCIWRRVGNEWQKEAVLPLAYAICTAEFSPSGTYISVIPGRQGVEIWRRSGGQWQNIEFPEATCFSRIRFSPDGLHLATEFQRKHSAIVWRCTDGQLHKEAVIASGGLLRQTRFSPHGNHIVTLSADETIANIWGVVAGEWREKATLPHTTRLYTAVFSRHGNWVLTTTQDGTVTIWSLNCQ